MTNDNFFNVLYERTSTRAFNPDKEISSTELHEILKAAAQAPSAWNFPTSAWSSVTAISMCP